MVFQHFQGEPATKPQYRFKLSLIRRLEAFYEWLFVKKGGDTFGVGVFKEATAKFPSEKEKRSYKNEAL